MFLDCSSCTHRPNISSACQWMSPIINKECTHTPSLFRGCTMQSGVSPVIFKQTMMRQSWCFPWNRCSSSACQPTECSPSSVCSWSSMLSCWRRLFRKQRCKTTPIPSQSCSQCRAFCEIVQSFVVGGMLGWLLSCMVPFKGHVKEPRKNDWKATTKPVACAKVLLPAWD